MFPCDKCGACCRNLHLSSMYAPLDRGDGVCKYLRGNLCSIFENRPLLCRVDESYEQLWKKLMTREEYYEQNQKVCDALKAAMKGG